MMGKSSYEVGEIVFIYPFYKKGIITSKSSPISGDTIYVIRYLDKDGIIHSDSWTKDFIKTPVDETLIKP